MVKYVLAIGFLFSSIQSVSAQTRVRGYYRQNGTYVQPHYRSSPDRSQANNWSTVGNVNPYTGVPGTHRIDGGRIRQTRRNRF